MTLIVRHARSKWLKKLIFCFSGSLQTTNRLISLLRWLVPAFSLHPEFQLIPYHPSPPVSQSTMGPWDIHLITLSHEQTWLVFWTLSVLLPLPNHNFSKTLFYSSDGKVGEEFYFNALTTYHPPPLQLN